MPILERKLIGQPVLHLDHISRFIWLAYKLWKGKEKKTILKLQEGDTALMDNAPIQKALHRYCTNLYNGSDISLEEIGEYLKKTKTHWGLQRNRKRDYEWTHNNKGRFWNYKKKILNQEKWLDQIDCQILIINVLRMKFYNLYKTQWILSYREEKLSESWKQVNTPPHTKKGEDLTLTSNFRLVLLLNNYCKLFTMILVVSMKIILQEFVHEYQCGFGHILNVWNSFHGQVSL